MERRNALGTKGLSLPVYISQVMVLFEVGNGWSWKSNGEEEGSLQNWLSYSSWRCTVARASRLIEEGRRVKQDMRDMASAAVFCVPLNYVADISSKLGNEVQMPNFTGGVASDGFVYSTGKGFGPNKQLSSLKVMSKMTNGKVHCQ